MRDNEYRLNISSLIKSKLYKRFYRRTPILIWVFSFLICYSSGIVNIYAGELSYDNELWTEIEIISSISKRFDFKFRQQVRFNNNVTKYKSALTDIGFRYKFSKHFRFSSAYRHKRFPDKTQHGFLLNFYSKISYKKFDLTHRLRYQKKYGSKRDQDYARNRLTLKYEINKKIESFITSEIFYRTFYDKGDRFDKIRFYLGGEYKIDKKRAIKLYYMLQREFNVNNPVQSNIIGVSYSVDF